MKMWKQYNPNPLANNGIDCAVRALSVALDITWEEAYAKLCAAGFEMGDMPTAPYVFAAVMRKNGFKRKAIPDECPDCYTAGDFADAHPVGVYVLAFGDHVCAVKNGDVWDSWDSTGRVPQYYWYKEE